MGVAPIVIGSLSTLSTSECNGSVLSPLSVAQACTTERGQEFRAGRTSLPVWLCQRTHFLRRTDGAFCLQTGGHLGSSLGVIELTLALHYVYECPQDRIIWDVGHQARASCPCAMSGQGQQFSFKR